MVAVRVRAARVRASGVNVCVSACVSACADAVLPRAAPPAVRGNKPSASEIAKGADPEGEWDLSALARFAIQGEAVVGPEVRELVDQLQHENWRLRVQVAHLQGDRIGLSAPSTFKPPTRRQNASANRRSRRILAAIEPYLHAIWEKVEAKDAEWWSVEGMENLIFTIIRRGLPNSGARFAQRWTTKRLLSLLWDDPLCRQHLEAIRAQTKKWLPREFNAEQRAGHAGQLAWRKARKFMGKQMYRLDTLRSSRREEVSLAKLWMPMGASFDEPVVEGDGTAAARQLAARTRARRSAEREESERKLLRTRTEKELVKLEEQEAARMSEEGVAPLTSFAAAGIALLLRNEPTKDGTRKIPLKKRRESAADKWSRGGEAAEGETRVFEGAEVHHLVISDSSFARNSSEAMLGFVKLLATEHEVFVDELHVAPAAQGKKLSYHLLDAIGLLHEAREKQARLQLKRENKYAVRSYKAGSFGEWTPPSGGVWGEADAAEDEAHMMMATTVGRLADAVAHRCRAAPLAPGLQVLHFLGGEEVDHVAVQPRRDEPDGVQQPRPEQERLSEMCICGNLADPVITRLIGRSMWNVPMSSVSIASSFLTHLSLDAGNMQGKGIDRRCKQVTVVQASLKCWGVGGDAAGRKEWEDGEYGAAHVRYGMPLSQSCDKAAVIGAWLGDDHSASQERGFVPFVNMAMADMKAKTMTVPYMYLALPPILYDENLNVEFKYPVGKKMDVFARFAAVGEVIAYPRYMISMDLAAENEFTGVDYSAEKQSSWANETKHSDQSRLAIPYALGAGKTVQSECKHLWPKCWKTMVEIVLMLNDPKIDWSTVTRKPAMEERPVDAAAPPVEGTGTNDFDFPVAPGRGKRSAPAGKRAGNGRGSCKKRDSGKRQADGASGGASGGRKTRGGDASAAPSGAPVPRGVEVPDDVREQLELQWVDKDLRDADFDFDKFKSSLDGTVDGAATSTAENVRIIRFPVMDAFGDRKTLPDILGGDMNVARKHMAMCILHADMRIPENVVTHFEGRLRERLASGGSAAAVEKFNAAMVLLRVRHRIALNPKSTGNKTVYPATFDGTDSAHLRADWLLLAGADLAACARSGIWPSEYFAALHAALVAAGDCADVLLDLPSYAECALHYAQAMVEARKMPHELRPDPEPAHARFESESKLFTMKWLKLGFGVKAYGYHLWANLPTLFRRVGSLEGVSQQSVEGTIGKVARLMPHLQLKPGGKYANAIKDDRAARLAELERRRATLDSPSTTIMEELMMEGLDCSGTYGMTTKDSDAMPPLRTILSKIDQAIALGRVVPYSKFSLYWKRYMFVESLRARGKGRAQAAWARAAGSSEFADLKGEVEAYFSAQFARLPVVTGQTQADWEKTAQRLRSRAWRAVARPNHEGIEQGKRGVPGTELAYQRIAPRTPPAAERLRSA